MDRSAIIKDTYAEQKRTKKQMEEMNMHSIISKGEKYSVIFGMSRYISTDNLAIVMADESKGYMGYLTINPGERLEKNQAYVRDDSFSRDVAVWCIGKGYARLLGIKNFPFERYLLMEFTDGFFSEVVEAPEEMAWISSTFYRRDAVWL